MIPICRNLCSLLLFSLSATAAVRYVDVNGTNATFPFTNWATAATAIQDAVDAAEAGDDVLVADGVYSSGGRRFPAMTNRVHLAKPVTLRSLNGPQFTVIHGGAAQNGGNGDGATRCVYVGANAVLSGFTLTNGHTRADMFSYSLEMSGGGAACEPSGVLTNCILSGNSAYRDGGGAYGGTLYSCRLANNSATYGGATSESTLHNCTLTGNSTRGLADGGGDIGGASYRGTMYHCTLTSNSAKYGAVAYSTLYNCTLTSNSLSAAYAATLSNCLLIGNWGTNGGGAYDSRLNNCTLIGNSALFGGAANSGSLTNCTVIGNSARYGGGTFYSGLYNCVVSNNTAISGGGAMSGTLNNCTVVANSAAQGGGVSGAGPSGALLYNCIVYFNTAPNGANYGTNTLLRYCCTIPEPTNGVGSITNDPSFIDYDRGNLRLHTNSLCINAGDNNFSFVSADFDGRPRLVGPTVDMGAYEFQPISGAFIGWLGQYGLPTDASGDFADADGDAMNNWQEWICGTNPTNALSLLRLLSPAVVGNDVKVSWESVADMRYFLECRTAPHAPFTSLATNVVAQLATTTYTHSNAAVAAPFFYRVGVAGP